MLATSSEPRATAHDTSNVARVLLIEDSDIDCELLLSYLERMPIEFDVVRAANRRNFDEALPALASGRFDIILSDYSLPDFDGNTALRLALETAPEVPFLFVSGVVGEDFATDALIAGATDYVLKRNLERLPKAIDRALRESRERVRRRRAEAALQGYELRTRVALEAARFGFWDWMPTRATGVFDERCRSMLGVAPDAAMSLETFFDRCHPADRDRLRAAVGRAMDPASGSGRVAEEFRIITSGGVVGGFVGIHGDALFEHGVCVRFVGVVQDVTERRQDEARQRQTEILFRIAVDAAEIGVWDYDAARDQLFWDEWVRELAGVAVDSEVGYASTWLPMLHPDDREWVDREMRAAVSRRGPTELEFTARFGAEGGHRLRWVAVKGRRIIGPDGGARLLGTMRDVTEERRKDDALQSANQSLEERVAERTRERDRIWSLSPDLMLVCRIDGKLAAANPAWSGVLGWQPPDLAGAGFLDFIHADDVEATLAEMQRLGSGESTIRFDSRARTSQGGYRWVRWTLSPDDGIFYGIGRDVTEERHAADEIASANRQLVAQIDERERVETTLRQMQRLEAVGQLTSGVAHDFNNLLTVVLSNLTLVDRTLGRMPSEPDTVARLRARVAAMRDAAERGAKLTGQLLAFSRRQRLEPHPIDLNETVLGMRELLQSTMGGSIRIDTDLAAGLWPALVDPTQIELIILNLAINARDAMEVGGSLTVRTHNIIVTGKPMRAEDPEPGEYAVLAVTDTGTGMSADVLAKAFEPFFTTKDVGKGSGLGLAQVYGFAKQSGGGARIETSVGRGTSVHVYLPRAAEFAPRLAARDAGDAPQQADSKSADRLVLVVDDDHAVREATTALLSGLGYRVIDAGSGGSALELLDRHEAIDLMVADFAMPGMNGAEVARAARSRRPGLPVLFVTGYIDLAGLEGVDENNLLQKPFSEHDLASKVARLMAESRSKSEDPQ
ncbi:hypothetical protein BH09PSE6_BH09PSE6_02610 [soil metagenome]